MNLKQKGKENMKKILMIGVAALAGVAMAAPQGEFSLSEAKGKLAEAIGNPSKLTETISRLSAADQKAYLAEVNNAISKRAGSPEKKTATYLDANRAAMQGAKKGNMKALLAETFATVPPEALTVINERFASELFNRAADPSQSYTDDQFTRIATETMKVIQERNLGNEAAGVRNTFAILMFLRASNGTPENLRRTLLDMLPDDETRTLAKVEWIPPAMGEGQDKTYEPMLAAADAGKQPNEILVLRISGPGNLSSLLADLGNFTVDNQKKSGMPATDTILSVSQLESKRLDEEYDLDRIPRFAGPVCGESIGYAGQTIWREDGGGWGWHHNHRNHARHPAVIPARRVHVGR